MRDALVAWDGTLADADRLRVLARDAGPPRGKPEPDARGVAKVLAAYGRPGGAASLVAWLAENPTQAPAVAPLIGDPAIGPWPWADPLHVPTSQAVPALTLLGRIAVPVDDAVRSFLRVMLRVRRRSTWTLAARAIAVQAVRDVPLQDTIGAVWQASRERTGAGSAHLRRHALVLGAAWVVRGGVLDGLDVSTLARRAWPEDDADRSVHVLALAELTLDASTHDTVHASFVRGLPGVGNHPLTERALVTRVPELPGPTADAVRARLSVRRWTDADGLLAWADSVVALGLDVEAGDEARALGLARAPAGTALELVERIRPVLDPQTSVLLARAERAIRVGEAVAMLASEDVREVQWAAVARAIGPFALELPGSASASGGSAIGLGTALAGWPVQHLLREGTLSVEAVLAVARVPNGFVSTQVAVHTERALRAAADDPERVRILWRLLQADPPTRAFEELIDVVRADALPGEVGSGPLVDLVRAVCELDRLRDRGAGAEEVAGALRVLAGRAAVLGRDASVLVALADVLDRYQAGAGTPLGWIDGLGRLLGPQPDGLFAWSAWIDLAPPEEARHRSEQAQVAVGELRRAAEGLASARPRVDARHVRGLREAARDVQHTVTGCGWPERLAVEVLLDSMLQAAARELDVGHAATAASRRVAALLQVGDEAALRAVSMDAEVLALLDVPTLRRLHGFLLDQLLWRPASELAGRVRARVGLPSASRHLLPLYAAVAGGSFLVLDFGGEWVEMADHGVGVRYALTIALTLGMSYGVLCATLGGRFADPRGGVSRWSRVSVRALPVLAGAAAVAATSTALVLVTLDSVGWQALPVFASLALFLGVFVGLVLQGRTPADRTS